MHDLMMLQTYPVFAPRPRGESRLLFALRMNPMTTFIYSQRQCTVIDELPDDGILVMNQVEVQAPMTVEEGDVLMWIPGSVC